MCFLFVVLGAGGVSAQSCTRNPYTGRFTPGPFADVFVQWMVPMGNLAFQQWAMALVSAMGEYAFPDRYEHSEVYELFEKIVKTTKFRLSVEKQWYSCISDMPDPQLVVARCGEVNAYTFPGGQIVLCEEMMEAVDESVLVFVLAHEVAHYYFRHTAEKILAYFLQEIGIDLVRQWASVRFDERVYGVIVAATGILSQVGFVLPFNRMQEREADHLAFLVTAQLGARGAYDPREVIGWFEELAYYEPNIPPFLRTHPSASARAYYLRGLLNEVNLPKSGSHE